MNNSVKGLIAKTTAESLTDKEGYLLKLNSSGYVTRVTAETDVPVFVCENGAASGSLADCLPWSPETQHRVKVSANVAAGALLQIDASNAGQLVTRTTGKAIAQAEAACAAGGLAHVRPLGGTRLPVTVVALTSTNGTMAAAADDAAVKVEGEKIGDDVRAIHAALVTAGIITAS